MSAVDYKIKCFDEAGFKLPDVAKANYGHSLVGASCIEVARNINIPNVTLQVLAGLEGILYTNTVDGTTDTVDLLNFFGEASENFLPTEMGSQFFDMAITSYLTTMPLTIMKGGMLWGDGWMSKELKWFIYRHIRRNLTPLSWLLKPENSSKMREHSPVFLSEHTRWGVQLCRADNRA